MNLKFEVNDVNYKIEVTKANKDIPVEEILKFIEWIKKQPISLGLGKYKHTYTCQNGKEIKIDFIISG